MLIRGKIEQPVKPPGGPPRIIVAARGLAPEEQYGIQLAITPEQLETLEADKPKMYQSEWVFQVELAGKNEYGGEKYVCTSFEVYEPEPLWPVEGDSPEPEMDDVWPPPGYDKVGEEERRWARDEEIRGRD